MTDTLSEVGAHSEVLAAHRLPAQAVGGPKGFLTVAQLAAYMLAGLAFDPAGSAATAQAAAIASAAASLTAHENAADPHPTYLTVAEAAAAYDALGAAAAAQSAAIAASQPLAANLTSWSALAPSAKQDAHANLTTIAGLASVANLSTLAGLSSITPLTRLAASGETVTTSSPLLDLAQTWNAGAVAFTGLKFNATDTASDAASRLISLQLGGNDRFYVGKGGNTYSYSSFYSSTGGFDGAGASSFLRLGQDTWLVRDAANIFAQRNGANAQTFRLYLSYTDASNYTRLAFKTAANLQTIETESAGTGNTDIDLALTPKGTGRVRFGTHAGIAAETVTGYITIKDAGGTSRKIAVVS